MKIILVHRSGRTRILTIEEMAQLLELYLGKKYVVRCG
jgi:hypothetical protein